MIEANPNGFFPDTPATDPLHGLRESLRMRMEKGLGNVFRRHARFEQVPIICGKLGATDNRRLFLP